MMPRACLAYIGFLSASDLYTMHIHPLVLLSLLSALTFAEPFPCEVVRYVSPANGTNNSSCLNSADAVEYPCKNLSFALLGRKFASSQLNYHTGPDNLCVYLDDGIHYLSGQTQLRNSANALVKSLHPGKAIVRCRSFPNDVPRQWDNMAFVSSRNITVKDLIIEHCGPISSGIFAYKVHGIHIRNCTFR